MDLYDDKNIKPMLLSEKKKPFDNNNYIFEIKFDGIRALIYVSKDEIIIKNKRGFILNETYPELLSIKSNFKKKCIFDGEIVLMQNGLPSFEKLQERALLKDKKRIKYFEETYPVTFVCFDILYENKNLTELPLTKRKNIINKYPDTDFFIKNKSIDTFGTKLFKFIKEKGIEGIVAKKKDSKYLIGKRSKEWIKIKNWKDDEYFVGAYKEEEFVASLVLCIKEDNKLKFISKVTVGKKTNDFKLIKQCKKIKNNITGFSDNEYNYITPKYKCTVIYMEKTKNGHLRQPIFKGIRID